MQLHEVAIGLLSGVVILFSQIIYIQYTWKKRIRPSLLTWIGWALLMGVSLFSQIRNEGWQWSMCGHFLSTFGCAAIALAGYLRQHYSLLKTDWMYLFFGMACLVLYLASKDPWLTTFFAIAADLILGIPTLRKAYLYPATERSPAWLLGFICWSLALTICIGHSLLFALFPIYLFLFNGTMVWLTRGKLLSERQT